MSILWPARRAYISDPPPQAFVDSSCRRLVILGSTGSIGGNALSIVAETPQEFGIIGLACGHNVEKLATQAERWRPPFLAVAEPEDAAALRKLLPKEYDPEILSGCEGYATLAALENADCVLSAQSGSAGLAGTLAAALAGKVIALANKESLVLAGPLIRKICAKSGASILPVDSEHNAIFQCLAGRMEDALEITLTASGGPFRGRDSEFLASVTPGQALKHPNWSMGAKITVDSATLMNKGLEIIEAGRLYDLPGNRIRAVIHPQSIVHSLVRFYDNSLLAQMAVPDMRLPIAACLLWPRCRRSFIAPLDLTGCGPLTFEEIDSETFPCVTLARRTLDFGMGKWEEWNVNPACIVLNGANEAAVSLFLRGECKFTGIPALVSQTLDVLIYSGECPAPDFPDLKKLSLVKKALALARGINSLNRKALLTARELNQ